MASKSKRRSRSRSSVHLIDHVRRNLERGDFRRALKDARVCHRQDASPEHRCLLEHAYIGRAQQLAQNGQVEDSRRIVRELLDLGVTEPSVEAGLPEVLVSVGMLDCLPQGLDVLPDGERERLAIKAVDQAVLRPEHTPSSMPELKEDAGRVRAALAAAEQGDDAAALEHLRDVPRQSHFADWKFFVRGLIAYYGHDATGMLANWDRLDADRAAAGIAAPLKVLAGVASAQNDGRLRSQVSRLEKQATNQTIGSQLARLRQVAADHDWRQVFRSLRSVRGELRELDTGLYQRLVSCLCGMLVRGGLVDELGRLAQIVDPPPIDPRWNRAKAVACENSDSCDQDGAAQYWRKYLVDLGNLPTLTPSQRSQARGLIWLRLAHFFASDAKSLSECCCGADHGPEIEDIEERACNAYTRCLTLAPSFAPAYEDFAAFHLAADRRDEAAGVMQRLLEHEPDHLEALRFLGQHYAFHGEPVKAREFAQRARALKPLDRQVGDLLWSTHAGEARELARCEQYDQARAELANADRLQPSRAMDYDMLARKAVLEIRAGDAEAARQFVEQAQERLCEPTALWLIMAIEAIRHDLPREEVWLYEKRWHDALKRRCRSQTAGLTCRLLFAHRTHPQPYPQIEEHVQCLLKYVRRCSRVKWQAEDLRFVCEFLEEVRDAKTLTKFARQGKRKFPQVGYFHCLTGLMEMAKGPYGFDQQFAVDCFRQAIQLASDSGDPRDERIVGMAKRSLSRAENVVPDFDDYEDDDDEEGDFDENVRSVMEGVSPEEMYDAIRAMCERVGLDPEGVFDEVKGGGEKRSRQRGRRG